MDKYYLLSYFFIENRGNSHNIYVEDTEGIQTLCHARNNIPFGEGKYIDNCLLLYSRINMVHVYMYI